MLKNIVAVKLEREMIYPQPVRYKNTMDRVKEVSFRRSVLHLYDGQIKVTFNNDNMAQAIHRTEWPYSSVDKPLKAFSLDL